MSHLLSARCSNVRPSEQAETNEFFATHSYTHLDHLDDISTYEFYLEEPSVWRLWRKISPPIPAPFHPDRLITLWPPIFDLVAQISIYQCHFTVAGGSRAFLGDKVEADEGRVLSCWLEARPGLGSQYQFRRLRDSIQQLSHEFANRQEAMSIDTTTFLHFEDNIDNPKVMIHVYFIAQTEDEVSRSLIYLICILTILCSVTPSLQVKSLPVFDKYGDRCVPDTLATVPFYQAVRALFYLELRRPPTSDHVNKYFLHGRLIQISAV